ncbi:MAG: exo-alpha-sialidase, partial [bacterium]|nr:exo-alpha-sialidase [Candidatus Kapabacteria bacterium]
MSIRYTLLPRFALPLVLFVFVNTAMAQPESKPSTTVERFDYAERSRPTLERYRDKAPSKWRPYLMSVGVPVASPLFANRSAVIEAAGPDQPQNESSIAINPLRPNVLLASAVDYRNGAWVYISTDAGNSWRNVMLGDVRSGWPSGNDPSVAFDHLGHGYVMYGAIVRQSPDAWRNGQSGIFISKTTNDGVDWVKHIPVIEHVDSMTAADPIEDKYYIEIDRSDSSAYRGWMYTPWKRVTDADSATQIMFARSTNGGANWSTPIAISVRKPGSSTDTTWGQSFPISAAGPSGEVYVAWHDGQVRSIGFARSLDGGATFTAPRLIITGNPTHGSTTRTLGNETFHVLKGTFRAQTYPTLAVDNSLSARRGWLYLVWAAGGYPDIYFARSTDQGQTWSPRKLISSDTTNDQFWPWLSVDPLNGDIAVMYSDSRHDPANILIDQYVAYSSNGGDTWVDRRATDSRSDYRKNPFQGI